MKSVTIDPRIEADDRLLSLVDKANRLLESELGPSGDTVSASWQLDERLEDNLWLEIEDWTGRVRTKFSLEELASPRQTSARLVRLWGDLLQVRAQEQIESLAKNPPFDDTAALAEIDDAVSDFVERTGREPQALKLPVRYAIELMKLGPSYWGEDFQAIRRRGTRAFDQIELFGMRVQVVPGVHGKLELE
ncbi:MAG: hypothetical protein WBX00_06565 [Isosphaeraceae bacterium]